MEIDKEDDGFRWREKPGGDGVGDEEEEYGGLIPNRFLWLEAEQQKESLWQLRIIFPNIKTALKWTICSFGEEILPRREKSYHSLCLNNLNKQTLFIFMTE